MVPRALVTGGAGFIGSHLCEKLLAHDWDVTVVDNLATGTADNLSGLSGVRLIEADVNKPGTWRQLSGERFQALFHYAATVGVKLTEERPTQVLTDVEGISQVAKFAKAGGADRVVFASSSEVYGDPAELPEEEEEGIAGWSPYATVKLFGEHTFRALWQEDKIPTVSLRFFNVYGPRQTGSEYGFVVAKFIDQVLAGESPTVFGDGQQTRDFVYIEDNVRAALAAIENDSANGQVINVGSGRETKVLELAKAVIKAVDLDAKMTPVYRPARPVEIKRRLAAVDKLHSLLGVQCETVLDAGIRATVMGLKEKLVAQPVADRRPVLDAA